MNTIKVTEILGTDSIAGSRIIINDNFSMLQSGLNNILNLIDISNKSIRINSIETENGDFVIFGGLDNSRRFTISHDGIVTFGSDNIMIGDKSLRDYIIEIINEQNEESNDVEEGGDTDNETPEQGE